MRANRSRLLNAAGALALCSVIATATLCGGVLASAGTAWAHAVRVASDPGENAAVTEQPARVSATFNEPMQARFAAMTVLGPDGASWSDGGTEVDGAVISVGVRPGGPIGDYTVNYRATSADGHVVAGSWSYRLVAATAESEARTTLPAAPSVAAEPPATDAGAERRPMWPFVAAVSAILAAGAILAVRRRR